MLEEENESAEIDDERGYQVGDLRRINRLVYQSASVRNRLDEERCEYRSYRVKSSEECRGDSVESHARYRGLSRGPFLITGQEEECSTDACEGSADCQRYDDILLFFHARIHCGFFVVSRSLQLISELGLGKNYPNQYGEDDGQRNSKRYCFVVGKQCVESCHRDECALVGR